MSTLLGTVFWQAATWVCSVLLNHNLRLLTIYRSHIKRSHKHIRHPNICPDCSKRFTLPKDLKRHQQSVHQHEKLFMCKCGLDYSRKDHLLRHIDKVTKGSEDEKRNSHVVSVDHARWNVPTEKDDVRYSLPINFTQPRSDPSSDSLAKWETWVWKSIIGHLMEFHVPATPLRASALKK
jgi:hypothetical protein